MLEKIAIHPNHQANLRPSERRAQATLMMVKRIFGGMTVKDIGEEFSVSSATAGRRLAQARQDGVPEAARELFIEQMLPTSMAVLKEALEGEDMKLAVQVALKVVDGLNVMDAPKAEPTHTEETLVEFRARISKSTYPADAPAIDVQATETAELAPPSVDPTAPVRLLTGWQDGEVQENQANDCQTSDPSGVSDGPDGDATVDQQKTGVD